MNFPQREEPYYTIPTPNVERSSWIQYKVPYIENVLNYRQENPIIDADNPFGTEFDASMVWGPIFGRNIYAGFRWTLKNDEK